MVARAVEVPAMSDGTVPARFRKVNLREIEEIAWSSESGSGFGKQISEALGREAGSTDILKRHPFDVEVLRVTAGTAPYRYHSHSAQWEYYQVIAGNGTVRHDEGLTPIGPGDAFLFKPGEPHQIVNDGTDDLVIFVVADNPVGESYHFPDDDMWIVNSPQSHFVVRHPTRERAV